MVDLTTTNILLGVMALVSVLEAIALVAAGVIGLKLYRQVSAQVALLEARHVQPLRAQATTILDTVQRISAQVEHSTTRVDAAVQGTMQKAEQTVERVQGGARRAAGTVVGVVRGVRTALETFLTDEERREAKARAGEARAEETMSDVASAENGQPPRRPAYYPEGRPDSPVPPAGLP